MTGSRSTASPIDSPSGTRNCFDTENLRINLNFQTALVVSIRKTSSGTYGDCRYHIIDGTIQSSRIGGSSRSPINHNFEHRTRVNGISIRAGYKQGAITRTVDPGAVFEIVIDGT